MSLRNVPFLDDFIVYFDGTIKVCSSRKKVKSNFAQGGIKAVT